ncbi:helix-turn-helix domain-containing protein [Gimesia panareensis]|uniref:helix-turn-helix domain-containing protein n=1 Tax=Gimesia panareensis TaxID=2527978 RepID=UPI001187E675|nr:helix-turn-helix domain-containing protein [Gimesia panareensis]QDU50280.1 Helix-turn-helix domain protein [Gimesia panareensis]
MTTVLQTPPLLLTEREAAHLLNCCEKTVYTMRQQGKLQFVRLGSAIRYPREELEKFIASQSEFVNDNSPESN